MSVEHKVIVQFILELGEIIGGGAVELRFLDFIAGAGGVPNSWAMLPRETLGGIFIFVGPFSFLGSLNTTAFAFGLLRRRFHLVVHGFLFGVVAGSEFEQTAKSFGEIFSDFKSGFNHL